MITTKNNVLWEVVWMDGRREVVEARNLQQDGGALQASISGLFGGPKPDVLPEMWVLFHEGRGVVWVAEKKLISIIRCLNPAGDPVDSEKA